MQMILGPWRAYVASLFTLSCTFYTECPTTPPAAPAGSGGSSGGGSSNNSPITGNPPEGAWRNVTGNLAGLESGCGNLDVLATVPGEDAIIAGVSVAGLFKSREGSEDWEPLGTDDDSDSVDNRPRTILFDPNDPGIFWEAGSYGGGVFRTRDAGKSFVQLGDIVHTDSVSVDFTDPDRQTLLAGAHEQNHTLFKSTDGGKNWDDLATSIPSSVNACSYPLIIDTQTFLLACSKWGTGNGGIYRSSDGGENWEQASERSAFWEAFVASDGAIYWSGESSDLQRSDDDGETFEFLLDGIRDHVRPTELPDGRIATLSADYVILSDDRGKTWHPVTPKFPVPDPLGVVYSAEQKAFFLWYTGCDSTIRTDAIQRFDFDYELE